MRYLLAFVSPVVALAVGCATTAARSPATRPSTESVVVRSLELQTPAGLARGHVATVDLNDPAIEVVALMPREVGLRLDRRQSASLVEDGTVDLAVNANYFGGDGIVGLCVVDGETLSWARGDDPVLLIHDDGRASIGTGAEADVRQAVAGVGPNPTVADGTTLVLDGENLGATARVEPMVRHPRTAAGVDESGRKLVLIVMDGRQPDWSVGVTLPELADLMLAEGVADAVNLDGGTSSAMAWRDGDTVQTSRASGGGQRKVPVHLGVRVQSGGGE